jgi:hypothetical protein
MERPAPAGNLRNAGRADISNATSRYRAAPLYTHGVRPCTVSSRHFSPDIVDAAFRYLAAPLQTHVVHPTLKGRAHPVYFVGEAAGHMERPAPSGNRRIADVASFAPATSNPQLPSSTTRLDKSAQNFVRPMCDQELRPSRQVVHTAIKKLAA